MSLCFRCRFGRRRRCSCESCYGLFQDQYRMTFVCTGLAVRKDVVCLSVYLSVCRLPQFRSDAFRRIGDSSVHPQMLIKLACRAGAGETKHNAEHCMHHLSRFYDGPMPPSNICPYLTSNRRQRNCSSLSVRRFSELHSSISLTP